jgi:hypothetical protein
MTLLPEVSTLRLLQYNRPPCIPLSARFGHEEWWGSFPTSVIIFSLVLDRDDYTRNCSSTQHLLSVIEVNYGPLSLISFVCHIAHRLHIILCRVHFLWMRRARMLPFIWFSLQVQFLWASPNFIQRDNPSEEIVTFLLVWVKQILCNCMTLPLLHFRRYKGHPTHCNFAVSKNVVRNVEQPNDNQHPAKKQGAELCGCQHGGHPERQLS